MNPLSEGMFLCAGFSTRMRPLTNKIPKVLLPLGKKTIFEWMVQYFISQNIRRISINLHHGSQFVEELLQEKDFNIEIKPFKETKILGSGGGVKNMQNFLTQDHFFTMNCDVITEGDLQTMYRFHVQKNALATLFITPDPHQKYTKIYAGPNQQISSILQPDSSQTYLGMFGGVAIFSKEIFSLMPPEENFCLVTDCLEALCKENKPIFAYKSEALWFDTGEIQLYDAAVRSLTIKPFSWMGA